MSRYEAEIGNFSYSKSMHECQMSAMQSECSGLLDGATTLCGSVASVTEVIADVHDRLQFEMLCDRYNPLNSVSQQGRHAKAWAEYEREASKEKASSESTPDLQGLGLQCLVALQFNPLLVLVLL